MKVIRSFAARCVELRVVESFSINKTKCLASCSSTRFKVIREEEKNGHEWHLLPTRTRPVNTHTGTIKSEVEHFFFAASEGKIK